MSDAFAECERIVREADPDRAVANAFAPADRRPFLAALYAFDDETAKIRRIVSQPMPGEIRLQWWRDRIDAFEADPLEASGQGSPVAEALFRTIERFDLPLEAFRNLLDARIFDLYDDPMPDRAALEAYAGETASAATMLAAMILDRDVAPQAADAAGHAGIAKVAVDSLSLLPHRPAHAHIFVPDDVIAAVGCSREALQGGDPDAANRATAAFAAYAQDHLAKANTGAAGLPRSLRPAFLPLRGIEDRLARIASGRTEVKRPRPIARLFDYWRTMRR